MSHRTTGKVELGTPTLFRATVEQQTGWIVNQQEVGVYVLTENGRDYVSMSNICTHLGCRVRWIEDQGRFFCPCHNGVFDAQGSVLPAPPDRLTAMRSKWRGTSSTFEEFRMATRLATWLDDRIHWRGVWQAVFLRKVPKVNWLYTLGSATLFVALNQAVTGILLTLYYVPTPDHAYDSVQFITQEVTAGWLIRGLHHWGASAMVVLCVLHMQRVIFHGAYKFPREVTWWTGVILLVVVIGFGFTGYLLPWDQKAYWATTVGTRIAGVTPVIGDALLRAGGRGYRRSLARLRIHVWVLPALLLIGFHMYR
jgi:nitrite reductase/ring-hydroxylating ferredoxin subunit